MGGAIIRFYAGLNHFLSFCRRQWDIRLAFMPPAPLRHLIEIHGVSHSEVESILLMRRHRSTASVDAVGKAVACKGGGDYRAIPGGGVSPFDCSRCRQ